MFFDTSGGSTPGKSSASDSSGPHWLRLWGVPGVSGWLCFCLDGSSGSHQEAELRQDTLSGLTG